MPKSENNPVSVSPDKPKKTYDWLHKWQPGQSGNPGGRPKNPITQALKEAVQQPENATMIRDTLLKLAKAGDIRAIELLLNRTEGKVPDKVEQGGVGAFDAESIPDSDLKNLVEIARKAKSA